MEVYICTPENPGHLVNHLNPSSGEQSQAGADQPLAPERGQEKGESRKRNLSRKAGFFNPFWIGGSVSLFMLLASFINVPKAQAADRSWGNVDVAKKAISSVAPIVSDIKPDETSASLALTADNFIQKPFVVETEITPEPVKPKVLAYQQVARKPAPAKLASVSTRVYDSANHKFPYGYCTYYVAQKRDVRWSGNANSWLYGAQASGYATGDSPRSGAIVVTSEGPVGHVAYVESVNGDQITISEMNFKGFGVVSTRTLPSSAPQIRGYIY